MKEHCFLGAFDLSRDIVEIQDQELAHQIKNVLKLHPGELVVLGDGQGNEVKAEILALGRSGIKATVKERRRNENEPGREVILYVSILKRENFEWALHKAVEVGVSKIIPVISARTIKTGLNLARLRKISKEAAELAHRGKIPEVGEPKNFKTALKEAGENDVNLFFDFDGEALSPSFQEGAQRELPSKVGVFIGPEGGWTEEENKMAREAGCKIISLGKLSLKAETAATLASYLIAHILYL